jgi:hypothetical protein
MKTSFTIDRVCYAVEFTQRNEFLFFVDVANSEKVVYDMSSFERAFGDAPPETVWTTTGSGHVFEIKRHVEDFIDRVVNRFNPFYFSYCSNEPVKLPLYRRFARRLCTRHPADFSASILLVSRRWFPTLTAPLASAARRYMEGSSGGRTPFPLGRRSDSEPCARKRISGPRRRSAAPNLRNLRRGWHGTCMHWGMYQPTNDASERIPRRFDADALDEAVELFRLLRENCPADDLKVAFTIARSFAWRIGETAALLSFLAAMGDEVIQ